MRNKISRNTHATEISGISFLFFSPSFFNRFVFAAERIPFHLFVIYRSCRFSVILFIKKKTHNFARRVPLIVKWFLRLCYVACTCNSRVFVL